MLLSKQHIWQCVKFEVGKLQKGYFLLAQIQRLSFTVDYTITQNLH